MDIDQDKKALCAKAGLYDGCGGLWKNSFCSEGIGVCLINLIILQKNGLAKGTKLSKMQLFPSHRQDPKKGVTHSKIVLLFFRSIRNVILFPGRFLRPN